MNKDQKNLSDAEVITLAQKGDDAAFEQLVYRYEKKLFSFLCAQTGHLEDARDITQRVFIKIYHALNRFDTERPFAPWLFTIARREAIQHFKSRPRENTQMEMPEEIEYTNPAVIIERKEQSNNIWKLAQDILSKNQLISLRLRFRDALSMEEIAAATGQTKSNVKVLLFRARKRLAYALRETRCTSDCSTTPTT